MENTTQFKDMLDIYEFQKLFEELTSYRGDLRHAISKWSDAKSSNPTLVKIFKDSLIVGMPVQQVYIDNAFLEQNNIREIFKNAFPSLEKKVKIINKSSQLRCWTEDEIKTLDCWRAVSGWRTVSLSFLDGTDDVTRTYNEMRRHSQEPYYRYLNRVIKKAFGKESSEAVEYNNLLTELSRFKHSVTSKEEDSQHMLCLSIHPKDFLTVSKGNSWSSCYNIGDDDCGDYASSVSGTLSSRDTVVAYVVPKEEYDKMMEDDMYTPEKHWRTFVVINPKQLLLMKGYPNQSMPLFKQITTWARSASGVSYKFVSDRDSQLHIESTGAYLDVSNHAREEYKIGSWYKAPDFKERDEFTYLNFAANPFYWDTGELIDSGISGTNALFSWDCLETCVWCGEYVEEGGCYDDVTGDIYCHECMESLLQEREEERREAEEQEELEREEESRLQYEEDRREQLCLELDFG